MSLFFVVHKTYREDVQRASEYLCKTVHELCPDVSIRSYYNGQLIRINGGRIQIDVRCGTESHKFAGIWPDYYYTDDDGEIANMLEMGACRVNGRRLEDPEQVVQVIVNWLDMFRKLIKETV